MKLLTKKILFTATLICSNVLLTACQQNPLMTTENKSKLKNEIVDRSFVDKNARGCSKYYANPQELSQLKIQCDAWSEDYYKVLVNEGVIPAKATLSNFRDSKLWQQLIEN